MAEPTVAARRPPWCAEMLALALIALLAGAGAAAAPSRAAQPARAPVAPAHRLQLVVPLVADDAGLSSFARAVSTPGSPLYGRYEPVPLLARRFGATLAVRDRVVRFLRAAGAAGVVVNPTGMFAEATMTVGAAERAFGVRLARFAGAAGAPSFIAPATTATASRAAPALPAGLNGVATGVIGLDTRRLMPAVAAPHTLLASHRGARLRARAVGGLGSAYLPVSGTQSGCAEARGPESGFTPNQYVNAYGITPLRAQGLSGQGERVALIEVDGYRYTDIKTFAACFGLGIPAINTYTIGARRPFAPGQESTLDLELVDAVAPGLKAIDVYENAGNAADVTRSVVLPLLSAGAKPQVISASLGLCEPYMELAFSRATLTSIERDVELAAATGITLVVATGDDGSSACVKSGGGIVDRLAVNYPATSPFVTAVGGTNIGLTPGNTITGQTVWNDTPLQLAAAGGGVSELFARPSYQRPVVHGSRRVVPDVAMLADLGPGYEVYCSAVGNRDCRRSPAWHTVGGTSAASPLLAAGIALIDEDLGRHGRVPVGFLNPLIYGIGESRAATAVLKDVTRGSNDMGVALAGATPLGCCAARPGFDAASGWGGVDLGGLDLVAESKLPRIGNLSVSIPRGQHPIRGHGLRVRLGCSQRCAVYAFGIVLLGDGDALTIRSATRRLRRRGSTTPFAGLTASDLKLIRAALRRHRRVDAELYAVGLDGRGHTAEVTSGVVVRITS